jgi:hypothetical protein
MSHDNLLFSTKSEQLSVSIHSANHRVNGFVQPLVQNRATAFTVSLAQAESRRGALTSLARRAY